MQPVLLSDFILVLKVTMSVLNLLGTVMILSLDDNLSSYCRYLQEMWIYFKSASVQGVCAARRAQQGTTQVIFLCSVV